MNNFFSAKTQTLFHKRLLVIVQAVFVTSQYKVHCYVLSIPQSGIKNFVDFTFPWIIIFFAFLMVRQAGLVCAYKLAFKPDFFFGIM